MINNMTEGFDTKLLKYSLVAGTVLLGAKKTDAQITVTNVNQTISNSSYTISFDGNARFDIIQNQDELYMPPFRTTSASAFINQNNYTTGRFIVRSGSHAKALSTSYLINSTAPFVGNSHDNPGLRFAREVTTSFTFIGAPRHSSTGASFIGHTKFIGVKFNLTDGTHYGWIKLTIPSNLSSITIVSYAYDTTPNQAIKAGSTTPLPVELTSFTANNVGNEVELNWHTATEVNNYGFDIERASVKSPNDTSSLEWVKIGFVQGSGNSNSPKNYSFVDDNPVNGTAEYRLKQIDNDGAYKYSQIVGASFMKPNQFELSQNYPNPFNPTTEISYSIPQAEHVTIKVYDELGKEVSTLLDEEKSAGSYSVRFDGSRLASGIYFYRITAGKFNQIKKLMLLK
jgi:Secretion system C-terminal sorting domain